MEKIEVEGVPVTLEQINAAHHKLEAVGGTPSGIR